MSCSEKTASPRYPPFVFDYLLRALATADRSGDRNGRVPLGQLRCFFPLWPPDHFRDVLLAAQNQGLLRLEPFLQLEHTALAVKDKAGRLMGYVRLVKPTSA
jgi:hypothetical protein